MIYFIIMIVFSPFTAVIPAVYAVNLLFRKKLKIEKNYWNIGLFLLFIYSVFSSIVNKDLLRDVYKVDGYISTLDDDKYFIPMTTCNF